MGINNDTLERATIAGGLALICFMLVFEILNGLGVIPLDAFSSHGWCIFPTASLGIALTAYAFRKHGAKNADGSAREHSGGHLKLPVAPGAASLAIGGATAALILLLFIALLSRGSGLFLPALIGLVVVLLGGLAVVDFIHIYGARHAYGDPSETNGLEEALEYLQMVKDPTLRHRPPGGKTNAQNSAPRLEKQYAPVQRLQIADSLLNTQKLKPYGDPIVGMWYSPGGNTKFIFYHDGSFDVITGSQNAGYSTYVGGIYRKSADGSYRVRPEFEGSSKAVARPISVDERKFILDGNRLYDADDEDMQFFKDAHG